jgi:hypothetical protein
MSIENKIGGKDKAGYTEPLITEIPDFRSEMRRIEENVHHRDAVRSRLATRLFLLIATLTVAILIGVVTGRLEIETAKDLGLVVLAPVVAIFASVIGFFFASENAAR